jgi:predicted nucleic acid-binding protein
VSESLLSNLHQTFVLDASVTLAWLFHDEHDSYADAVAKAMLGAKPLVPRLWHVEVANILVVSERRGRCTQADSTNWLGFLAALPITVDGETEYRAWSETIALARQRSLSVYDATYLELAMRENLPIATLDKQLIVTAKAVGVPLFAP